MNPFDKNYRSQIDWGDQRKPTPPNHGGWGNGTLKAIDKGRGSIGHLGSGDPIKAAAIKKPSQM